MLSSRLRMAITEWMPSLCWGGLPGLDPSRLAGDVVVGHYRGDWGTAFSWVGSS